ncbi:NIPA-like protein 3 [Corythoichthys intestinalis]|uniref:NIPA-like protein 3 n=1 Tax=Corythoichthys intestinalis TaxID=161448 RepID=UPI0025A50CFC|nr:NIPA-like protein 3 [Corythoichthys intestinalis]XP_057715589.1 NIPA-like protein 3 [Corythoichthys intestinalis]
MISWAKMDIRAEEGSYTNNLIGTLLALFGNVLVSISLNIQKYGHVSIVGAKDPRIFYYTKTWWFGFLLTTLGEAANFVSYSFAPLSLVAPLNVVSIITSFILGFIFMHEKSKPKEFAKRHGLAFLGSVLGVGGTYLFVAFGPNSHEKLTAEVVVKHLVGWPVLVYLMLEIITFCLLLYFYKQRNANYLVVILLLVALLSSVTVISVKAVSHMLILTLEGSMQLDYPIFSVMFVCMVSSVIFQASFLSQACKLYDSSLIASVNYILSTTFAVLAGAVFYLEFNQEDILHISMFLLGTAACFLSVFLITRTRKKNNNFEPYVTLNMSNGVPTIFSKRPDTPADFTGSFSYGALVNSDSNISANQPVNMEQPTTSFRPIRSSNGTSNMKQD